MEGKKLDSLDKRLLNELQFSFPIEQKPFEKIAYRLGIPEKEVLARIKRLKKTGIIRRVGGVFDSNALGFKTTLVAVKIKEEHLDKVAEYLNTIPGVTHNYSRDYDYNLWFTLIYKRAEDLDRVLMDISGQPGVEDVLNLPKLKLHKINAAFRLEKDDKHG